MRKILLLIFLVKLSMVCSGQIIANHNIVDKYELIPDFYINEVKKMWLSYAGESHAGAIRSGLNILESENNKYQVNITSAGTPEAYTDAWLRASSAMWGDWDTPTGWQYWIGEEDIWTSTSATNQVKTSLLYCKNNDITVSAFGFGWCWDASWGSPSNGTDPVTGNHWWGETINGPDGAIRWGLDNDDNVVTGNGLNMDSYLDAIDGFINFCSVNNISTTIFYTTGPVDGLEGTSTDENLYQTYLKWEYIRNHVIKNSSRVLFDYADILCYDNDGTPTTRSWNGITFPAITSTNAGEYTNGHISDYGALRLAKAMWWMLARIAGWDGIIADVQNEKYDNAINVTITYNSDEIVITTSDLFLNGSIGLFNFQGILLEKKDITDTTCRFNKSALRPGVYYIRVTKSTRSEVKKIILPN